MCMLIIHLKCVLVAMFLMMKEHLLLNIQHSISMLSRKHIQKKS